MYGNNDAIFKQQTIYYVTHQKTMKKDTIQQLKFLFVFQVVLGGNKSFKKSKNTKCRLNTKCYFALKF